MNKKLLFAFSFIALFIFSDSLFAQKYWVMFKNKTGTPYSVSTPSAFLSPKSIARRTTQSIAVNATDLPVTPSYVTQVDGVAGVTVLYRSKWLNGVVISAPSASVLTTINSFTFVQSSQPVNRYKISFPYADKEVHPNNQGNKTQKTAGFYDYGRAVGQATMVGVDCLHNLGFRGEGMTIAVLDAGFLNAHIDPVFDSLFIQKRIKGCRDFVTGDTLVFEDNYHGACCLSTMAALSYGPSVADTIVGTAPKANYWLLRTEDVATETISEEYNWIRGAEFADSVGADVCTTSLGYNQFDGGLYDHTYANLDGKTAPMSIASTIAARTGMIVLNAAGNSGCPGGPTSCWYYIGVPADADSIIAVGSVGISGLKSGFSSFGPSADGRIKPDLCAQGGPAYVCNLGCFYGNGTSFATPVLAGAVTCFWQSKPGLKNMQIIQGLKQYANNSLAPNNSVGWGIPNMCTTYYSTIGIKENEKNENVKIYPNPNNGILNVELDPSTSSGHGILNGKDSRIKITNTLGQTILEESSTIQHLTFNIQHLPSGIYFVNVSSTQYNVTKKIVKQ